MSLFVRSGGLVTVSRRVTRPSFVSGLPKTVTPVRNSSSWRRSTTSVQRARPVPFHRIFAFDTSPGLWRSLATVNTEAIEENPDEASPAVAGKSIKSGRVSQPLSEFRDLDTILHKLNMFVKRTGRVDINEVRRILKLVKESGSVSANQALMLIRCCGALMVDEDPGDRTHLAEDIWKTCEDKNVTFDASHYNALLKVYVDNGHEFDPTEFLKHMETVKGLEANRVTYQHLIARYCQDGNVAGATVIVEHMKDKEMTITESVFHSLITGHCRSGDLTAAREIIELMKQSGLTVSNETQSILVKEMARAGHSEEDLVKEIEKEDIVFSDRDYFEFIVELIRSGSEDTAKSMVKRLPKKTGFYYEMRNHLPEMLRIGGTELAIEILKDFKVPRVGDENHPDSRSNDRGMFLLECLVKSNPPLDKVMEVIGRLVTEDNISIFVSRILESCIDSGHIDLGRQIHEACSEKYGTTLALTGGENDPWIRIRSRSFANGTEALEFLSELCSVGIRPLTTTISNHILPPFFKEQPRAVSALSNYMDIASKDKNQRAPMSVGQLANAILQYFLNAETLEAFEEAARFSVHVNFQSRPRHWSASLARAYLSTGNIDALISVIGCSTTYIGDRNKSQQQSAEKGDHDLFTCLNHIHSTARRYKGEDVDPDQVLEPVLAELARHEIGFPATIGEILRSNLQSENALELTHKLEDLYEARSEKWSEERAEKFFQSRKSRVKFDLIRKNPNFIPVTPTGFVEKEHLPNSIQDAERIVDILNKKDKFNHFIFTNLFQKYIEAGDLEKADGILSQIRELRGEKQFDVNHIDDIITAYLKNGHIDRAKDFLQKEVDDQASGKAYRNTYIKVAKSMVAEGKVDEAIDYVSIIDRAKTKSKDDGVVDMCNFLNVFVQNGDDENLKIAFDKLDAAGLINKKSSRAFSPLIDIHLRRKDFEAAVTTFERLVKETKTLPMRHALMEKLIEAEDMERMQRVLDAAIETLGEERSLYDLAHNFLEAGKYLQTKKLLETPGLRYNPGKAQYMIERFLKAGNLDALENFVYLSKSLFGCDRHYLYNTLVTAFKDKPDKCREIWVNMQEEEFVPSDALKNKMARIFHSAGQQPPFEVPADYVREIKTQDAPKPIASTTTVKRSVEDFVSDISNGKLEEKEILRDIRTFLSRKSISEDEKIKIIRTLNSIPDTMANLPNINANKLIIAMTPQQLDELDNEITDPKLRRLLRVDVTLSKNAFDNGGVEGLMGLIRRRSDENMVPMSTLSFALQTKENFEKLQKLGEEIDSHEFNKRLMVAAAIHGNMEGAEQIFERIGSDKIGDISAGLRFINEVELTNLTSFLEKNFSGDEAKSQLVGVYNMVLSRRVSSGDAAKVKDLMDMAFKKWIVVEDLHPAILEYVVAGKVPGVSEAIKEGAKAALKKSRESVGSSSSSSSSSSDDEKKK